jgi:lysozyme
MEIKSVDQAGIDFIAKEEGCILRPYLDSVGVPTIGIGCTYYPGGIRLKMTDPSITREKAYDLFKAVLHHYETAVWSFTRDDINQNQFNALVSICYNIGVNGFRSSTLLKRVNQDPSNPDIREAFLMWSRAGSNKSALLGRRKREAKLYFS